MAYLENQTFDEIKVGQTATLKKTLTPKDIILFTTMSGDFNPAHVDIEYAKTSMFHKIIAQGMWGASFFSTLLGTKLPGPGTIYLSQTLKFERPIGLGDTIYVSVKVLSKHPEKHTIELACECVNQEKKVVISGLAVVLAPQEKIRTQRAILPKLEVQKSQPRFYEHLIQKTQALKPLLTAVVHPVDELSLSGAIAAAEAGLITPILIGPKHKIIQAAEEAHIDLQPYELIATEHSHEAADKAVRLAKQRKIEALMKGKIHTDELMKAVIHKTTGLRTERRMSHVFMLEFPNYPKPIFLSDAAINLFPSLEDKKDIVQNAIDLFKHLDFGTPKVAILSAIETVNEKIPSTLDATALCKMSERGQITGGILDGPLAFDNAISEKSAHLKGLSSTVAGDADILIVPDIEAGNMLYKQVTFLSGLEAAGIVLGARVPIILTSRSSDILSRQASCALALLYSRNKEKLGAGS